MEFDSLRQEGKYVFVTLKALYNEYLKSCQGAMKRYNIFSIDNSKEKTRINRRGTNESTIYFLVPLKFRKFIVKEYDIDFQIIEDEEHTHFIYSVKKVKK